MQSMDDSSRHLVADKDQGLRDCDTKQPEDDEDGHVSPLRPEAGLLMQTD